MQSSSGPDTQPGNQSRPDDAYPEHRRLVMGAGRYVGDVAIADALFVTFVRSPLASGRLVAVDVADAAEVAGVVAVYTGKDIENCGTLPVSKPLARIDSRPYPILALNTVQAVGQPMVAIVAESLQAGADAADLVSFEIDEPVGCNESAVAELAMADSWVSGDIGPAFAKAAHVVEATVVHPRLAPAPLETRSIAVQYNADDGRVHVWLSTQTPHRSRDALASILGVASSCIRLTAPDVGGAFGMKASLYPEEVFTAWAAFRLRRSVRWQATRNEDFLSASHGRGANTCGRLAIAADGRFLGLEARVDAPLGYWLPTSAAIPAWNAARILPGPYLLETVRIATRAWKSYTAPVGIYRGAGRPEAALLMERLVDKAARATGLDPLEIRRLNFVPPEKMPWRGPAGVTLDSGRYDQALTQLAVNSKYTELQAQVSRRRAEGELVGLGVACFVEPSGQGWESARVDIAADGQITAASGGSAQGQSRISVLARIVAEVLEVPPESIKVLIGDTETCPAGIGALASRSTAIGGSAMRKAALQVRDQRIAGQADTAAPARAISAEVTYDVENEAVGNGCYLALVSIDTDTGKVRCEELHALDDAGHVLDKALVHDQILGGIAQGVGEALMEQIVYDEHGQLLTGSLMDYAMPRADDMPAVFLSSMTTPSPNNLLGAKGVGEAGTIGAPAAISNAVQDALAALTSQDLPMPFTAERVWQVLNSAQYREKQS